MTDLKSVGIIFETHVGSNPIFMVGGWGWFSCWMNNLLRKRKQPIRRRRLVADGGDRFKINSNRIDCFARIMLYNAIGTNYCDWWATSY